MPGAKSQVHVYRCFGLLIRYTYYLVTCRQLCPSYQEQQRVRPSQDNAIQQYI